MDITPTIYQTLKHIARTQRRREARGGGQVEFQTTTIVSEAFVKLMDGNPDWHSRAHFYGAAARAMRNILVDAARRRMVRAKHRNALGRHKFAVSTQDPGVRVVDLIALDDALRELEAAHPKHAEVVSLRYFAGLSITEVAETIGVDPKTVRNRWDFARAWLYQRMNSCADEQGQSRAE